MKIANQNINQYKWLEDMYSDGYFPSFLIDKIKLILLEVCQNIEENHPKNLDELYTITNAGVIKINDLQGEFDEHGSEIETIARETIGADFFSIAKAYSFDKACNEALIDERDW